MNGFFNKDKQPDPEGKPSIIIPNELKPENEISSSKIQEALKVTTSCKECFFAEYIGNSQVDCKMGMIDKFKEKGYKLEIESDTVLDEDGNKSDIKYYTSEKICHFYRTKEWSNLKTDHVNQAKEEVQISVDIILILDKECKFEDFQDSIDRIKNQENKKISQLIVVQYIDNRISELDILGHLKILGEDTTFQLISMTDLVIDDFFAVDYVFRNCKSSYYSVFKAGFKIPKNFVNQLNVMIYEDLEGLPFIEPDKDKDINGYTVQRYLHEALQGNAKALLSDKIKEFAENTGSKEFLVKYSDVIK